MISEKQASKDRVELFERKMFLPIRDQKSIIDALVKEYDRTQRENK